MGIENGIFKRAELLLGEDVMGEIASKRVIVFGVGGVGSWCVECLVRSGIRRITIVDGQITVQGMDVADVIVCNASGAVVSTGETTVTGLPSGVYVVKVKTKDGKTVTKKLVK